MTSVCVDKKLVFLFHKRDGNADVYINNMDGTEIRWEKHLQQVDWPECSRVSSFLESVDFLEIFNQVKPKEVCIVFSECFDFNRANGSKIRDFADEHCLKVTYYH